MINIYMRSEGGGRGQRSGEKMGLKSGITRRCFSLPREKHRRKEEAK
jgi:hypothetical protein